LRHKAYIKNFKQKVVDALPADTDLNKVDEGYTNEAGFTERFVKDTDKIQIRLLSNKFSHWVYYTCSEDG
jgi:hypothetical protein